MKENVFLKLDKISIKINLKNTKNQDIFYNLDIFLMNENQFKARQNQH